MNDEELLPLVRLGTDDYRSVLNLVRGREEKSIKEIENKTLRIIDQVKAEGDKALRELTLQYDKFDLGANHEGRGIRVGKSEIRESVARIGDDLASGMRYSLQRIRRTQGQLLRRLAFSYVSDGFTVRSTTRPLDSVGCYIPGGRAAYVSSVLMTPGVAKLAGVERVVVCTPPDHSGKVSDAILAACDLCGVDEVYRVGGAQSIAALAYGTESIPRVSKIVGPGGMYPTVAKRLVSKDVPIDFLAGPTELVVVGDGGSDPRLAAWDLVGQAEHGADSLCCLVTWDEQLATSVERETRKIASGPLERADHVRGALARGFAIVCRDKDSAQQIVNGLAPEHVEVMLETEDAHDFARGVKNAGLILLGKYTPCAASDYCIGTDHVIPTNRQAVVRGGLSVLDFLKLAWEAEGTRDGLKSTLPHLAELTRAENFPNHFKSVEERFRR